MVEWVSFLRYEMKKKNLVAVLQDNKKTIPVFLYIDLRNPKRLLWFMFSFLLADFHSPGSSHGSEVFIYLH